MRYLLVLLFLLFTYVFHAQVVVVVDPPPSVSNNKNWTSSISYDFSGATISKGLNYFNVLGKPTQQQSWDILTQRIWASEVRYDYFNRPVLQTLSAPINSTSLFGYKPDFISFNGTAVGINQYDTASTLFNPTTISADANSLGWYYSASNNLDPYQDVTVYPYTRAVYSDLNPGGTRAVLGGNKISVTGGTPEWLQTYSFTMPMELGSSSPLELTGRQVIKTVSRDVKGYETVVFTDSDGNTIAAARSGNEENNTLACRGVFSQILDNGYVDIHIPAGCSSTTVTLNNVSNNNSIRIFNLVTEALLPSSTYTTNATSVNLPPGFYRFEDVNNYYGKNILAIPTIAPIRINYTVNYYDYSLNQYDYANRLVKSTQPLGSDTTPAPLQSTFEYNSLGQLLSTTSPDEGASQFKYRRDGQIRFSQNSEQAKINSFSYTNYDTLGRPVESGVYTGAEIYFNDGGFDPISGLPIPSVDSILEDIDGLPLTGRTEQNFTQYDHIAANDDLLVKLAACSLPDVEYKQTFLSGNVTCTYTKNPFTTKTWYSYDVYGRVKWTVQEIPGLSCPKTINYTYNPVNGQLVRVDYQRYDGVERFIHKYNYNAAGQLVDVHTSINDVTYTKQAHYIYNESGALVRTELASNLQGIDYIYNLNGQLKAINHPSIINTNDPGQDGVAGTAHSGFVADVFGMAIDYYSGDYTRTGTPKPVTSLNSGIGTDQYNGNIKATRWNTQTPSNSQNGYTYSYNKNNWLSFSNYGVSNSSTGNSTGFVANLQTDYQMSGIEYDSNGNIKTLKRNGYTDGLGTNPMDNLTYRYGASATSPASNRLLGVSDVDNSNPNRYNDIRSQGNPVPTGGTTGTGSGAIPINTSLDNYVYNDLGQLTMNLQDKVIYDYNASGLVTKISTFADINTPNIEFKTLYLNDYSNFTSTNHGWYHEGANASNVTYFTLGIPAQDMGEFCIDQQHIDNLTTLFGTQPEVLQMNGIGVNKKFFKVTPNTTYRLNLDAILDNRIRYTIPYNLSPDYDPSNPNNPDPNTPYVIDIPFQQPLSVVINIKNAGGTSIANQTITHQGATYCDRYYSEHAFLEFTTTTESYIILELNIPQVVSNVPTNKFLKTFVDNVKLEAATNAKVKFYYNDRGQRVLKESYLSGGTMSSTFYVRDASGSVMGVYQGTGRSAPSIKEHSIFGSGRIGVFKRTPSTKRGGYELYELTDHLGNVRAVIQKTGVNLIAITNKTDYYPFGMPMPNKYITDGNYRYQFQGQEKDPETGMEAFELRLWDGRLGRWLTTDPYGQYHSPYIGMGNNPISLVDPSGGSDEPCPTCPNGVWQVPFLAPDFGPQLPRYMPSPGFPGSFSSEILEEVAIVTHRSRSRVNINFGPNANENFVSQHTRNVLNNLSRESGVKSLTITSTMRTAEDQARAMYNNIVSYGAARQKQLYGKNGDKVIDTYTSAKLKGGTAAEIKAAMVAKINQLGPNKVSKHCGDPNILNVIDISPRSINNGSRFIRAVNNSGDVSKFLQPPSDPAYHLEIPQN